jgi:PAS domain S-box-containing protein
MTGSFPANARIAKWTVPAVIVLGLVLSIAGGVLAHRYVTDKANDRLNALADLAGSNLSGSIAHFAGLTRALQASFLDLPGMPRGQFHGFVDILRRHAGTDPIRSYVFAERRGDDLYIRHAEPAAGNEWLAGLRITAVPANTEALGRLGATGALTTTLSLTPKPTVSATPDLTFIAPVYHSDSRTPRFALKGRQLEGIVAITVDLERMLAPLVAQMSEQQVRLRVAVLTPEGAAADAVPIPAGNDAVLPGDVRHVTQRDVDVQGTRWRLTLEASPELILFPQRHLAFYVPAVLLTLTLLLAALAHTLVRSRREAERHAEEVTRDLRKSEARFRDLAEQSSDWYWEQDEQFRFTQMSIGVSRKSGIDFSATIGKTRWELPILGVSKAEWATHRAQLERHEPFRDFTYQMPTPDRGLRWFAISGRPMFDAAGHFTGYRGTGTDITERKHTEIQLRLAATVFENSREGVTVTDAEQNIISVNHAFTEITGYTEAEVLGRNPSLLQSGRQDRAFYAAMWQAIVRDGYWSGEIWNRRKNGEVYPELLSITVVRDEAGKPLRYIGVFTDITERHRAEEAVQRERQLLEAVMDSLPVGVWLMDGQGRIIRSNPAATRIWAGARYVGVEQFGEYKGWWADTGREIRPEEWAAARAFSKGETSINEKIVIQCFDGSRRTILNSAVPLFDAEGRVNGAVIVNQDIDSLERAQLEIRQLNEGLEQRVRERTAALEASNRELEAFSYSVSHDLRAPLRGIDGFAHILAEDYGSRLDDTARGHLERIRRASQRLSQTIDDMIELARITRMPLHRREVDLSALARTTLMELSQASRHRPEVVIAESVTAQADPALLRIVLENLLDNAWKFSSRTPGARIEFGMAEAGGKRAYFVRDNGAGFDPAYADKLFKPFQRLHQPDEFAGTGIGLATVQRIVQRHGGRVWAEGAPGNGATFWFTLS